MPIGSTVNAKRNALKHFIRDRRGATVLHACLLDVVQMPGKVYMYIDLWKYLLIIPLTVIYHQHRDFLVLFGSVVFKCFVDLLVIEMQIEFQSKMIHTKFVI